MAPSLPAPRNPLQIRCKQRSRLSASNPVRLTSLWKACRGDQGGQSGQRFATSRRWRKVYGQGRLIAAPERTAARRPSRGFRKIFKTGVLTVPAVATTASLPFAAVGRRFAQRRLFCFLLRLLRFAIIGAQRASRSDKALYVLHFSPARPVFAVSLRAVCALAVFASRGYPVARPKERPADVEREIQRGITTRPMRALASASLQGNLL